MFSYQKSMQTLYEPSENFDVILPIEESDDSPGLCLGFTLHWSVNLILDNFASDINFDKNNDNINQYHKLQWSLFFNRNFFSHDNFFEINKISSSFTSIALTNYQFSNQLSYFADQYAHTPLMVRFKIYNLYGSKMGHHVIGLYQSNNILNFFDSNCGWFNFKSKASFEMWLPKWCNLYRSTGNYISPSYHIYSVSKIDAPVEPRINTLKNSIIYFSNHAADFLIPDDMASFMLASLLFYSMPTLTADASFNWKAMRWFQTMIIPPLSNGCIFVPRMIWHDIQKKYGNPVERLVALINKYSNFKTGDIDRSLSSINRNQDAFGFRLFSSNTENMIKKNVKCDGLNLMNAFK